jgi:hypothetical protein
MLNQWLFMNSIQISSFWDFISFYFYIYLTKLKIPDDCLANWALKSPVWWNWYMVGFLFVCWKHSWLGCSLDGPMQNMFFFCLFFVFSEWRWKVIVRFVDIGGIVNHRCLNFLFINRGWKQIKLWNHLCDEIGTW